MKQIEQKVEQVKERFTQETLTIKIELERVKTHGTTILPGIASNKIKPPTYDSQIPFETYRLQFEVACKANNWRHDKKALVLVVAL